MTKGPERRRFFSREHQMERSRRVAMAGPGFTPSTRVGCYGYIRVRTFPPQPPSFTKSDRLWPSPPHLSNLMTTDFNKMWRKARATFEVDETESVRTLAKILSSADGRTFVSDMKSSDAMLCIEILDHVSSNPPSAVPNRRSQVQRFECPGFSGA